MESKFIAFCCNNTLFPLLDIVNAIFVWHDVYTALRLWDCITFCCVALLPCVVITRTYSQTTPPIANLIMTDIPTDVKELCNVLHIATCSCFLCGGILYLQGTGFTRQTKLDQAEKVPTYLADLQCGDIEFHERHPLRSLALPNYSRQHEWSGNARLPFTVLEMYVP